MNYCCFSDYADVFIFMKRFIVLIFFFLSCFYLIAQNGEKRNTLWRDCSTRGIEFTVKGIVGPAGGWIKNHNTDIPPMLENHYGFAYGGGVILSYRINKCMSVGLGLNVIGGTKNFVYSSMPYGNLKFNVYDGGKFLPYLSFDIGYDLGHLLFWNKDGLPYDYNEEYYLLRYYNGGLVLGPAIGVDIPCWQGSAFVELRSDINLDYYNKVGHVCPAIGFGYIF